MLTVGCAQVCLLQMFLGINNFNAATGFRIPQIPLVSVVKRPLHDISGIYLSLHWIQSIE